MELIIQWIHSSRGFIPTLGIRQAVIATREWAECWVLVEGWRLKDAALTRRGNTRARFLAGSSTVVSDQPCTRLSKSYLLDMLALLGDGWSLMRRYCPLRMGRPSGPTPAVLRLVLEG